MFQLLWTIHSNNPTQILQKLLHQNRCKKMKTKANRPATKRMAGSIGQNYRKFARHLCSFGAYFANLRLGSSISRPVIPKRGEKEYEPKTEGAKGEGSGLQKHYLDRARAAMLDALRATRSISRYLNTVSFPRYSSLTKLFQ